MRRIDYPPAIRELIAELKRMPGIGPRSAERIALWIVQKKDARPGEIANAIQSAADSVHGCRFCGFFTTNETCEICSDETRATETLCVVEQPTDIIPIERTGIFRGLYHSLGGKIAPLDHIGPEDLRINSLIDRVVNQKPEEVILALGADVEGEATSSFIAELLREFPVSITRLAQGMPAGVGLESADELTLGRALSGRTRM